MTITAAQQQALFVLNSGAANGKTPVASLRLSAENLSILVTSPAGQPFLVTVDPSGAMVGLETQSAYGDPSDDQPWKDVLSSPNSLEYRYVDAFGRGIAAAVRSAEINGVNGCVATTELPEGVRDLTTIPADALAALADPEKALWVAHTAANPRLVDKLAKALHVIDQTGPVPPARRNPWLVLDQDAQGVYIRHARFILTAIATTGSPFSFPGVAATTRQAAYAVMLFTVYWANRSVRQPRKSTLERPTDV